MTISSECENEVIWESVFVMNFCHFRVILKQMLNVGACILFFISSG